MGKRLLRLFTDQKKPSLRTQGPRPGPTLRMRLEQNNNGFSALLDTDSEEESGGGSYTSATAHDQYSQHESGQP